MQRYTILFHSNLMSDSFKSLLHFFETFSPSRPEVLKITFTCEITEALDLTMVVNFTGELNSWSSEKKGTRQCCLRCCSCVTVKRFASTFSRLYIYIYFYIYIFILLKKKGWKIWEHNYLHKLFIDTLGELTIGQLLGKKLILLLQ